MEACSRNKSCRGKAISITHSECVSVALVTQRAMWMRRIILKSEVCPNLTFSWKKLPNTKCVFFLYKFCLKYFSSKKNSREILSQMHIGLHVKYLLFLSDLNENWIFPTDFFFSKMPKYQISWQYVQCEQRCSMWSDRQTYMTTLRIVFPNFANAHRKLSYYFP
jgi:hypothetical protein